MTYAGFRLTGRFATTTRPDDRTPAVAGDTWARDKVGGVGGTDLDATFVNRLKANLEAFVLACGGDLNDGDAQLANAILLALATKAATGHNHDDRYYVKTAIDESFLSVDDIVDTLTSTDAEAPLSAKQGKALKDLIDGLGDVIVVADMTAAGALTGLDNGDLVHVLNNGSSKWVRYQITAAGNGTWAGATKVVIWTQEQAPSTHGHNVADLTDASVNAKSLLQAADYAAMRTALGLGTAAVKAFGTGANQLVELDGSSRLPAVDGSQLTNVLSTDGLPKGILNRIINGGFEVWQRGTGATNCPAATPTLLADRWAVVAAGATMTQQRSTSVPSGARSRYSLQITGATSGTTCNLRQRIEAADIPALRRTVVFTAKVRNDTGGAFQPVLLLGTPAASDDFTTVTNRLTQNLQSCADGAWTTVSHSVDISGYTDIDNGLQVEIQVPSGSLNGAGKSVKLAEVSLSEGAAVSVFAPVPVAIEEIRCKRYYQTGRMLEHGYSVSSGGVAHTRALPVPMRATPTVVTTSTTGTNNVTGMAIVAVDALHIAIDPIGAYVTVTTGYTAAATYTASAEI